MGNELKIELMVNRKCLGELKMIDSMQIDNLYLRAVSFLNFLGSNSKRLPQGWKFCSIELLRKFHCKFDSLILPELLNHGFCHEVPKRHANCAREFVLEFDYEASDPHIISLPENEAGKWLAALGILDDKKRAAGYWINTREPIRIDFKRSQEAVNALLDYKRSKGLDLSGDGREEALENIQRQFAIIERINDGEILETWKSQGRAYSIFSELSKPVTSSIYDKDENRFISCDQHATYFTILPTVLKTLTNSSIVMDEIERLQRMIIDSPKIYAHISNSINSMFGKSVTSKEIKGQAISWLCDKEPMSKYWDVNCRNTNVKKIIDKWFEISFPECWKLMNRNRRNAFLSRRIAIEESRVFGGASQMLNRLSVPCLYKFDEILVIERNLAFAMDVLDFFFIKRGIPNKLKCDNEYSQEQISDSRFRELESLWESVRRLRSPQSVREFLVQNESLLQEILRDSYRLKEEEGGEEQPLSVNLTESRTSQKAASIKPFRKGYRTSFQNKDYYSKSDETEMAFRERLEALGARFAV